MKLRSCSRRRLICLLAPARSCAPWAVAETFRVATYNVENYLDEATETRSAKSAEAKAKVRESILRAQTRRARP